MRTRPDDTHDMTDENQLEVVRSSDNLFTDLGVANAEEELAKAELSSRTLLLRSYREIAVRSISTNELWAAT